MAESRYKMEKEEADIVAQTLDPAMLCDALLKKIQEFKRKSQFKSQEKEIKQAFITTEDIAAEFFRFFHSQHPDPIPEKELSKHISNLNEAIPFLNVHQEIAELASKLVGILTDLKQGTLLRIPLQKEKKKENAAKPKDLCVSLFNPLNEEGAADGPASDDEEENSYEPEKKDMLSSSLNTSVAVSAIAFFGERLNELSKNISSFPRKHSTAYNIACTVVITTVIVGTIVGITAATFGIVPAAVALATVAAVAGHAIAGAGVVAGTAIAGTGTTAGAAIATHKLITASAATVTVALSAFATAMFFGEKNEAKKKTEVGKHQIFRNSSCLNS